MAGTPCPLHLTQPSTTNPNPQPQDPSPSPSRDANTQGPSPDPKPGPLCRSSVGAPPASPEEARAAAGTEGGARLLQAWPRRARPRRARRRRRRGSRPSTRSRTSAAHGSTCRTARRPTRRRSSSRGATRRQVYTRTMLAHLHRAVTPPPLHAPLAEHDGADGRDLREIAPPGRRELQR